MARQLSGSFGAGMAGAGSGAMAMAAWASGLTDLGIGMSRAGRRSTGRSWSVACSVVAISCPPG